jgi:hypothetical protein
VIAASVPPTVNSPYAVLRGVEVVQCVGDVRDYGCGGEIGERGHCGALAQAEPLPGHLHQCLVGGLHTHFTALRRLHGQCVNVDNPSHSYPEPLFSLPSLHLL